MVRDNYRTLSLVSHTSKALLNIILEMLRGKIEEESAIGCFSELELELK